MRRAISLEERHRLDTGRHRRMADTALDQLIVTVGVLREAERSGSLTREQRLHLRTVLPEVWDAVADISASNHRELGQDEEATTDGEETTEPIRTA